MTREELVEILQAFGSSQFVRMELRLGSLRLEANRVPAASAQIPAPHLGFFHVFVEPGTRVDPHTPIGVIRALQEKHEVKAGVAGTVIDVLVRNGDLVEFGQALLRLDTEPAA